MINRSLSEDLRGQPQADFSRMLSYLDLSGSKDSLSFFVTNSDSNDKRNTIDLSEK